MYHRYTQYLTHFENITLQTKLCHITIRKPRLDYNSIHTYPQNKTSAQLLSITNEFWDSTLKSCAENSRRNTQSKILSHKDNNLVIIIIILIYK